MYCCGCGDVNDDGWVILKGWWKLGWVGLGIVVLVYRNFMCLRLRVCVSVLCVNVLLLCSVVVAVKGLVLFM